MQCGKNVENKHKKRKRQTSDNDLGKKSIYTLVQEKKVEYPNNILHYLAEMFHKIQSVANY